MWKRELLKNKLYALLLVGLSLPVMFLDGDATATVLMLFFAVPLFFAKENWIMGGSQSHAFHDRIKELVSRYEMEDQDDIWLCTQMLKRIGVDIEAWHKESDHGT